ncbi:MAG: LamG-like jellyroll fold domain-containing protein, partial [Bacteroidota bacterium]
RPNYSGGSWRNLSFTFNPFNEDEIWLASNSSSNGNKLFRSLDGGLTWTNYYNSMLVDEGIKDMIYHASLEGDILYIMTNNNFFYYDVLNQQWHSYNNGLPVEHRGFMILPFYKEGKIRMASAKGIWEIPFLRSTKILSNPIASVDSSYCVRDTIQLESFSITQQDDIDWNWNVEPAPIYMSDVNARNPKVVLGNPGTYDLNFTIDNGIETHSKVIENFIHVANACNADSIPGNNLSINADGDFAVSESYHLNNVTHFSITGWWKPNGNQEGFAAIVSNGEWCAHCDSPIGLIFDYFGNRLWYRWPGTSNSWGSNSGIQIPLNEWSYVALTIEPTKASLYLNDQKYV